MTELSEWLTRVTAHPDDVSLRLVFADWLLERGDPRGRLMALQLDDERLPPDLMRKVKINVLIRDHGSAWCPPGTRPLGFRRGLPHHVEWHAPTDPAHLAWRSVEALHCALEAPPLSGSPLEVERPLLKKVTGLDRALFDRVLATRLPALEELSVRDAHCDVTSFMPRLGGFRRLRALGLHTTDAVVDARLVGLPLEAVLRQCAGLERLALSLPDLTLARIGELKARWAPRLTLRLLVHHGGFDHELDPDSGVLVVTAPVGAMEDLVDELAQRLGLRPRVTWRSPPA